MHEAAFAQAALPAPTVVLGTLLRPYSLGHELFLTSEANPIIAGEPVLYPHLESAVQACCQSWSEYSATDYWAGLKARLWHWRTWHWSRSFMEGPLRGEIKKFLNYREAGCLEFPISDFTSAERDASGRWPGAPFLLRLHRFVMKMGKTEAEAWDYPVGLAKMHWQAHYEAEGLLDIYNSHDEGFQQFAEQQDLEAAELAAAVKKEDAWRV
jgi:hypothetical protein